MKYTITAYYKDDFGLKKKIRKIVIAENWREAEAKAREYFGKKYYGKNIYVDKMIF